MSQKQFSLLAFIVLILSILGLIALRAFVGKGPVALTIQVCAIFLMLWARLTFGFRSFHFTANPTQGGLITNGPYRFVRHPIYAAVIYFIWAGAISHVSIYGIVLAMVATAALAVRIAAEERLLVDCYPEYTAYASRTKRIIPFLI
jgi:protein-S-isoprenylcysteine O-methyltransferase Ste14